MVGAFRRELRTRLLGRTMMEGNLALVVEISDGAELCRLMRRWKTGYAVIGDGKLRGNIGSWEMLRRDGKPRREQKGSGMLPSQCRADQQLCVDQISTFPCHVDMGESVAEPRRPAV